MHIVPANLYHLSPLICRQAYIAGYHGSCAVISPFPSQYAVNAVLRYRLPALFATGTARGVAHDRKRNAEAFRAQQSEYPVCTTHESSGICITLISKVDIAPARPFHGRSDTVDCLLVSIAKGHYSHTEHRPPMYSVVVADIRRAAAKRT